MNKNAKFTSCINIKLVKMVLSSKKARNAKTEVLMKAERKDPVPLIIIEPTHLTTEAVFHI